jgi:nucleoside-diphosphate-sugar epimerase
LPLRLAGFIEGDVVATYLVTGAAGFIGSNLVERFLADGHEVRGLDNFLTGKQENIDAAVPEDAASRFKMYRGDIRDADMAKDAMAGVDVVFHQAALPSVQRSVEDPLQSHDVNINGTLNLLMAARDAGVRRLVYAASSSAYGDSPSLPKVESMLTDPLSPYAVTKLVGEQYARVFAGIFGLETVCLRYFNVFGPRQDPASHYAAVIPKFITALLAGDQPTVYGDGEQSRDFSYIDNVVNANLLAADADGASGRVLNVACGERFTLNELLAMLGELMGVEVRANYEPARTGDVKHSLADITEARQVLNYEPAVDFRQGVELTVGYFKQKKVDVS